MLISTLILVGAEIEMARLEGENSELRTIGTRKVIERAKEPAAGCS